MKHNLKPQAYLRYGDDFIIFEPSREKLEVLRGKSVEFLRGILKLQINPKNDVKIKPRDGLKFLGVCLWPNGRSLSKRNLKRVHDRLNLGNVPSYHGLMTKHEALRHKKHFDWMINELL